MGKMIGHLGPKHGPYKFSECTHERKGFLNIYTFMVNTLKYTLEVMVRGHAVVVLPIDTEKRTLYMIKQPRFNRAFVTSKEAKLLLDRAMAGDDEAIAVIQPEFILCYECPAGMIDDGETPEQSAIRELREETGITVSEDNLMKVAEYHPSIGGCTEQLTAYFAKTNGSIPVMKDGGDAEGHESIEVWEFTWDEAYKMLENGTITSASSNILLRELAKTEAVLALDSREQEVKTLTNEVTLLRCQLALLKAHLPS